MNEKRDKTFARLYVEATVSYLDNLPLLHIYSCGKAATEATTARVLSIPRTRCFPFILSAATLIPFARYIWPLCWVVDLLVGWFIFALSFRYTCLICALGFVYMLV